MDFGEWNGNLLPHAFLGGGNVSWLNWPNGLQASMPAINLPMLLGGT